MDSQEIASKLAVYFTPFLPYLIHGSEAAAKEVGKKFVESAPESARRLWKKLRSQPGGEKIEEAAREVEISETPDVDTTARFAEAVLERLKADEELAQAIAENIAGAEPLQTIKLTDGNKAGKIFQELQKNAGRQEISMSNSKAGDLVQTQKS